jgi:cell division inhibitor SulA
MGAVATDPSAADRAALARSVLRLAEERTGASRFVARPAPEAAGRVVADAPDVGPRASVPVLAPLPGALDGAGAPVPPAASLVPGARAEPTSPTSWAGVDPEASARVLPVPAELGALLPEGALRRGATVVVDGSTSLVLRLLAEVSRSGGWVALVGLPDVGVLAAHQLGLALDRVALVPDPGPEAPTAVAALLDGVDAVVVGPAVALTDADRRRLSARARERAAVLLPTAPWPGAHVVLTAERSWWQGLGQGSGRLRSRALTVRRAGRGAAGRSTVLDVTVPALPHPWSAAGTPAPPAADVLDPDHRRAG